MATIVLQAVGAGLGTLVGGPLGGMVGRALGAAAGGFIDQQLFGRPVRGPRLSDLRVMASSEGAPVPRLWGRMRVAGQVIWATDFEEKKKSSGAKGGGGTVTTYSYFANFAVALCAGEIDGVGRVWADGKDFDLAGVTARIHTGSETQEPDSLIVAREGQANAPAYRGTAYVVFERLPLKHFGNRLPQLSFEVFRGAGGAAEEVRAVSIIPGSTEFGYDTDIVTRQGEESETVPENAHASASASDWSVSLDQLQASCRRVEAAALVVAWFGTDLRCGDCLLMPGVDAAAKVTAPEAWAVSGTARAAARLVSESGGGPAYGGTPADAAVIRAIRDLKARGLAVMFHPFILMDVPRGNGRPDPYGAAEQAAYPWRGRITCSVAPGRAASPDKTALAVAEIARFVGSARASDFRREAAGVSFTGAPQWSFRRMVLHYAHLCAIAGGVDAFLLGSELRGLTTLRDAANGFPFVAALTALASEVKAILPGAQISYGADWTEYSGHRPADGTGDVFFHLDPFWSSPQVGFIGIDNYMPLADWRDGDAHADRAAGARAIHDLRYLRANIAGGEGFDWYYRTEAERARQQRTPITDGTAGKPWVFRVKDLKAWWGNRHHDRPGGAESAVPTGWVPMSKPIWFTEAGCAAVDKGCNAPNAFIDAKSAESGLPPFSSGMRDELMQQRYIEAVGGYWSAPGAHNPQAPGGRRMVEPSRIFFWAWDARPFPHFPARADVWSDGVNYARGHWLNGRMGALPLSRLIEAVCRDHGFTAVDASGVDGLVAGFLIDRVMAARDALEGVMAAFGIDAAESGGTLRFTMRAGATGIALDAGALAELPHGGALLQVTRAQETDLPASVKLSYMEAGLDYRMAAVEARRRGGTSRREALIDMAVAVNQDDAQRRAQSALQDAWAGRETAELALPPSFLALEPGDTLSLAENGQARVFRIEQVTDAELRKIRARSFDAAALAPGEAPARGQGAGAALLFGPPSAEIMDLPLAAGAAVAHAPWIAATAKPWPGNLALSRRTGSAAFTLNRLVELRATMGVLASPLAAGPLHVFDRGNAFTVTLAHGELSAVADDELLRGANVAAVGSPASGFEVLQFGRAELVGPRSYRLSMLLRGQSGSEPEMQALRPAGERFVLLDEAVVQPELSLAEAATAQEWRIGPPQYDLSRAQRQLQSGGRLLGLRPLAPAQLRARRQGADVLFTWIRRSRLDSGGWEAGDVPLAEESEAYRLDILSGTKVKRRVSLGVPQFLYRAADIAADFGADPRVFRLAVAQVSTVYGAGAPLGKVINV